jgi:Fur family ferric uptake transcriptional regulator
MTHNLLDFPGKMHSGGYRVTSQRKAILDAICETGSRATVEEILKRLRTKSPTLNRSTVYRNLNFLQRMRLVNAAGSGKSTCYEIAGPEPHHHLVCRNCGREIGLARKYVDRLKTWIRRDSRFLIDDNHLCFSGICRECLPTARRKSRTGSEKAD